jgi:hypothetical protein
MGGALQFSGERTYANSFDLDELTQNPSSCWPRLRRVLASVSEHDSLAWFGRLIVRIASRHEFQRSMVAVVLPVT